MKYEFPQDFKWGSAVWAQGTEGAFDKDGKALQFGMNTIACHQNAFIMKLDLVIH